MKNGVGFDLAFGMSDNSRAAFAIIFAEFEGSKFNWQTMEFERQD